MAAFILVTGVFNFVLGYFLALVLADPPFAGLLSWQSWVNCFRRVLAPAKHHQDEEVTEEQAGEGTDASDSGPATPTIATICELPDPWQQVLKDDKLQLNLLVAGVAHYLRVEGAAHREHVLTAEVRARQAVAIPDALLMEQLAADLRFINVDWSRKLKQGSDLIEERTGRHGPAEATAQKLVLLLRDQGAQIAELDREVHALNFRAEGSVAGRKMLGEMQHLIHLTHKLRDELQRLVAEICQSEEALCQVEHRLRFDANTGLMGRLGLEALFAEGFKAMPRPSVAMRISLDRFGKVNQRIGARGGDQAIKSFASYLSDLVAAKCEKSLLARQAGGDFLLLAQDATVEELTAVGEHIRQSFEAVGFHYQETDFGVTLSIGVTAIAADASLAGVLDRLSAVRATALRGGQNRSARWENGSATLTLPHAIPVVAKTIVIESTAA